MDTTVGLEELAIPLGLGLVFLVQEGRRVAITGGPNAPGTPPRIQHSDDAPAEQRKRAFSLQAASPSIGNRQEASNGSEIFSDSGVIVSEPEFTDIGGEYLGWNGPDVDFADLLNPQANDQTVPYPSSRSSSLVRHSKLSTDQAVQVQQATSSSNVSIPTTPTSTFRSFIQRPKMKTGTSRIANLILHTLKSYPLMMMRHNTLPPFLHPRVISSDVANDEMEPLTNCLSLVHMISSGFHGSRKLFWKNVQMECERLREERLKLNKWELLAAMQALLIYILIRLDEGETDHNNYDSLLLATVAVMAKQLNRSDIECSTRSALRNYGLGISWKDWIFDESTRRLSIVYQVIDMLVYFDPAAMCELPTDLILAPLPAKKQLWEAGDESVWKAECEREPGVQTDFGLAANGELVKVDQGWYCGGASQVHNSFGEKTSSRSTGNWEEWCSGMDGFGGLVMLAASLIV
ncbi:hypothetical protein BGZ57DRAFT_761172 [Hyaloscypha finlandica]|nr:hypothetical protein BGZ57DRAFT_761172 [Hyaloscypha finlandica]